MFNRIEKYGVVLNRLTHDKIELVRRWRNDPKISQYMEYRDEITPEMQEAWFKKIDNDNNFYFLIEVDNKEIGLINVRDVNYDKSEGETGIFIWDEEFLNSTISFQAVLCITDFCFETLNLTKVIAHVLGDNKRAVKFNLALGFVKSMNQESIKNQEYTLSYNNYKIRRDYILKLIH